MPGTPRRPADQSHDDLLHQDDLPEGWYLHVGFPGDRAEDPSLEIDELLGYNRWLMMEHEQYRVAESDQNETIDGRWRYIVHTATRTRVMIRLQRQTFAVPEEVRITGVIYLPWRAGDPITSQLLRELPTARIEATINKRLFAMKRTETITGGKIVLPSGHKVSERDLLNPLGEPKKTPDFYELVALQHGHLSRKGDKNPSATMAEINGVALSTAQGWITKARERGLLPPGRRGRAG
ncbi:hypothetical protein DCE93_11910 [Agromyces badenianii]|uniref:Uncharacterized protein n=1 Tax=Agromyces badenianii TaxID=2080742 RepID=A0A2S0WY36_9MICO|nr:hypothetical protein [Agromyces badenianii]AWB96265.1 hypothetical protein DCE93_11910 [Agromyces badenianii]